MVSREPAFEGMMHCATTRDLRVNRTLLYLGVDTSTESAVYRPWPLLAVFLLIITIAAAAETEVREYDVRPGAHPPDVAPAADGGVWYTAQRLGARGRLRVTGQAGYYGRVDPASGKGTVFEAPRGSGPYGIATAPDGSVYYASLAGSHIARVDVENGHATVLIPPTAQQGARRVWADSKGGIWVSEWFAGKVARYEPRDNTWREWALPGERPQPYAIYVDERDQVWLSDFGANAIVRFDPVSERFSVIPLPSANAKVRQILGRRCEIWLPESGAVKLAVIKTR